METLNNICTLLTTESEFLTKIITSPTVIIELWLDFLLFTSILKISYKKSEKWIYILTLSLTSCRCFRFILCLIRLTFL